MKKTMNNTAKLLLSFFLLFSLTLHAEEQIVLVTNYDLSAVGKMLKEGWKVKHQSVAVTSSAATAHENGTFRRNEPIFKEKLVILITLEK